MISRRPPAFALAALALLVLAPVPATPGAQATHCDAIDDVADVLPVTSSPKGVPVVGSESRPRVHCTEPCFGTSWLLDTGAHAIPGALDSIWYVQSAPFPPTGPRPTAVNPYPGWVTPPGDALWVTTHAVGTDADDAPVGDYVYALDFTVPCIRNCHRWIMEFEYAADNHVWFELNGWPITPTSFDAFGATNSLQHTGCNGYRVGLNTLTAHVRNDHVVTGLLVDGYATIHP